MKNPKHSRLLLASMAALSASGLWVSSALAATYTLQPAGSALDWNTAATWDLGSGTPGGAAGDIAILSGDFNGVAQTVNLSSNPVNPLTTVLTLGDTNASPVATTIGSTGGSLTLNGATINSAGTVGAVNTISAPVSLAGGLNFGISSSSTAAANNSLTVSGKISPSVAGNKTIDNNSGQTVTLGDIDLSVGATASTITIRNSNTTTNNRLILGGTIADGSSVASALVIGSRAVSGVVQINGTNTYTGNTTLGVQGVKSTFVINSDQPFGPASTGKLIFGNTNNSNSALEAMGR